LYDEFVDKEYSYLHTMTGCPGIAQLPLPWCYETRIKQAFPNPEGRPYTGFKQTCASSKNKSVAVLYKFHLDISFIYTYTVVYKT